MATVDKCKRSTGTAKPSSKAATTQERVLRRRIYELLGKPKMASRQFYAPTKGWIYSRARGFSASQFYAHLRGEKTLALSPLANVAGYPCALFICWDIDELFRQRLPVMRKVLDELGASSGAWAATGSDEGRGKVLLSFASPMLQDDSVRFASNVLLNARGHLLWGPDTKKVDTFPKGGQGGVVRILGRNLSRTEEGHLDYALDMLGQPSDLSAVVPYAHVGTSPDDVPLRTPLSIPPSMRIDSGRTAGRAIVAPIPSLSARAQRLRTTPYMGNGTTVYRDTSYLAKAAIRHHGNEADGRSAFETWCEELRGQIPSDKSQTLRQIDDASTRDRVWREACEYVKVGVGVGESASCALGDWRPLSPDTFVPFEGFSKPSRRAWRVYIHACERVVALSRNPHCFPLSYSEWQRLGDYDDKSNCRKDVDAAEQAGMLFRLDRGEARVGGLITLLTFVGGGQTLQLAYDLGVATDEYKQRLKDREERSLPPFLGCVKDNRLWFPLKSSDMPEAA